MRQEFNELSVGISKHNYFNPKEDILYFEQWLTPERLQLVLAATQRDTPHTISHFAIRLRKLNSVQFLFCMNTKEVEEARENQELSKLYDESVWSANVAGAQLFILKRWQRMLGSCCGIF